MDSIIKQESVHQFPNDGSVIYMSSSGRKAVTKYEDFSSDESNDDINPNKKQRVESVLPIGFLDPLSHEQRLALQKPVVVEPISVVNANGVVTSMNNLAGGVVRNEEPVCRVRKSCKQFWKAGDYEVTDGGGSHTAGMDHVRVHPKFLHSNATSHKWALGAFAELLDNAFDEIKYGATYVNVDVLENGKDNSKMLLVQDNGGGMTADKMRQCMSLGYSSKSKMANTIGQYGNGFKTSTMRLGADVIVFSRSQGNNGESSTQSIGMLSYTFLRSTGKEDIVVPMIHYKKVGQMWHNQMIPSYEYCQRNLESIVEWSPYDSEEDLLQQFNTMQDHGTRIIIYNLWENDEGSVELDFETDRDDIQIKGVNRDEKKIEMARKYPNSRHFLTYQHSLRSYASILYRTIPPGFRIFLRGKIVDHHDIVKDMMHTTSRTYRPQIANVVASSDASKNMVAEVTLGFVKDATHHIDVQGFNVYHKNRLIKPFWRVWNAAGSDGRGVIGVLEANFVEPAHDKQGFERTAVLSRLEGKLLELQKKYWTTNCQLVGYAPRINAKKSISPEKESSSNAIPKSYPTSNTNGNVPKNGTTQNRSPFPSASGMVGTNQFQVQARNPTISSNYQKPHTEHGLNKAVASGPLNVKMEEIRGRNGSPVTPVSSSVRDMALKLLQDNTSLKKSLKNVMNDLQYERDRNKSLQNELSVVKQYMEKMHQEQGMRVREFAEERSRRDLEEEKMRGRLNDAVETIANLLKKVERLEGRSMLHYS